jgi:hypothetical protein
MTAALILEGGRYGGSRSFRENHHTVEKELVFPWPTVHFRGEIFSGTRQKDNIPYLIGLARHAVQPSQTLDDAPQ